MTTPDFEVRRPPRTAPRPRRQAYGTIARCLTLLALVTALLLPFLPGSFVPDTLDMCNQAVVDTYTDWHSPIFAGAWGFLDPWPEVLFVVQILLWVLAVHQILRRWLRPWVAVAGTAAVSLFPPVVGWLTNVGKDEWFTVAFLGGVALFGVAADAGRKRTARAATAAALGAFWIAVAARSIAIVPVGLAVLVGWPHLPVWTRSDPSGPSARRPCHLHRRRRPADRGFTGGVDPTRRRSRRGPPGAADLPVRPGRSLDCGRQEPLSQAP